MFADVIYVCICCVAILAPLHGAHTLRTNNRLFIRIRVTQMSIKAVERLMTTGATDHKYFSDKFFIHIRVL